MPDSDVVRPKWVPVGLPVREVDWVKRAVTCPFCGRWCGTHSVKTRFVLDVGCVLEIRYSRHYCRKCQRTTTYHDPEFVDLRDHYTKAFKRQAAALVVDRGWTIEAAAERYEISATTLWDWVRDARNERMSPVSAVSGGV